MNNKSKRFTPSAWSKVLVPGLLILLLLGLLATILIVGLSLMGITPA